MQCQSENNHTATVITPTLTLSHNTLSPPNWTPRSFRESLGPLEWIWSIRHSDSDTESRASSRWNSKCVPNFIRGTATKQQALTGHLRDPRELADGRWAGMMPERLDFLPGRRCVAQHMQPEQAHTRFIVAQRASSQSEWLIGHLPFT